MICAVAVSTVRNYARRRDPSLMLSHVLREDPETVPQIVPKREESRGYELANSRSDTDLP